MKLIIIFINNYSFFLLKFLNTLTIFFLQNWFLCFPFKRIILLIITFKLFCLTSFTSPHMFLFFLFIIIFIKIFIFFFLLIFFFWIIIKVLGIIIKLHCSWTFQILWLIWLIIIIIIITTNYWILETNRIFTILTLF